MNAVILAGGFGNRLKPLTLDTPKPMLTLCDAPIIDYSISQLAYYGIKDISFSLAYLPEKIIEWVLGYKDLNVHFNVENIPLGTCGGVKAIEKHLDNSFFVLSGDGISNIDLSEMSKTHHMLGADITIAVTSMRDPSLYGVVQSEDLSYVSDFVEKPKTPVKNGFINCGVYIINKNVLNEVPDGFFDFSKDLFPKLLKKGGKIGIYIHNGYWNDIGDFKNYFASAFYVKDNGKFYPVLENVNRSSYQSFYTGIDPKSMVSDSASLVGNIHNCIIGRESDIVSGAVLENCIVMDGSYVIKKHSNCIIMPNYVIDMSEYA